ncbi:MAG: LiaF domain-containing protein [Actinomycetota bacterium]|nr:cell wall-active antibiotics response protein [Actinomycetota bacterium]
MSTRTPLAPEKQGQGSGGITSGQTFGMLLLIGGVAWLLNDVGHLPFTGQQVLSVMLIVLGFGLLFIRGGHTHGLLIFIGIALSLTVLTGSPVVRFDSSFSGGSLIGDRVEFPTRAPGGNLDYGVGLGDLRVNLSRLAMDADTTVSTHTALGDVTIIVADDQPVELKTNVGLGDVKVFGQRLGGTGNNTFNKGPISDKHLLRLQVTVALGDVIILHPDS